MNSLGDWWWLRSPYSNNGNKARQGNNSGGNMNNNNVNNENDAVRPDLPQKPETSAYVCAVRAGAKEYCSHFPRRENKHIPSEEADAEVFVSLSQPLYREGLRLAAERG